MADTSTTTTYNTADLEDDDVQHGIDNNPSGDAEKGAALGGIGGVIVGALAGAAAGPVGAIAGAIIGGLSGSVVSGAAVAAVDRRDNDNTISGLGSGTTRDTHDVYANSGMGVGNHVPEVQTGGHDVTGGPDTRGILEKTADAVTGDNIDDKTGQPVAHDTVRSDAYAVGNTMHNDANRVGNAVRGTVDNATYSTRTAADSGIGTGISQETELGEHHASLKTGGVANDGTPDTRGIGEKIVDGITGDVIDDKTGSVVDHR